MGRLGQARYRNPILINFKLEDQTMPASQHQKPKSDIEISQAATKRRIVAKREAST